MHSFLASMILLAIPTVDDPLVKYRGGVIDGNPHDVFVTNRSKVILKDPTRVGNDLHLAESSRLTCLGGYTHDLIVHGTSVVDLFAGRIGNNVAVDEASCVNVLGGTIGNNLVGGRNCRINVQAGRIGNDLVGSSNAIISVSGGLIGNRVLLGEDSVGNLSGCRVEDVHTSGNSSVHVSSCRVGDNVEASNFSQVHLGNARIGNRVVVKDNSTVYFVAASCESMRLAGSGVVHWTGGTVADRIEGKERSTLHVYGTGLRFENGELSGTLMDQTAVKVRVLVERKRHVRIHNTRLPAEQAPVTGSASFEIIRNVTLSTLLPQGLSQGRWMF